ncbi:DUF1674 domain-containing protein [Solilutibacter pythonis]|uniref:DUF1674 domain-containing protein n=1 Tax=Solilutibacter pythonis TaxID=2483112 RepID=UPI001B86612A|nr:DUF1674 domain-containing protein [Lysobacter pythonis]
MIGQDLPDAASPREAEAGAPAQSRPEAMPMPVEIGGREGPEPTRYGDWEKNGRCIDF